MGAPPSIFTFPNRILFGEGARAELPVELTRLGVSRPLLVTDRGLVDIGLADTVLSTLRAHRFSPACRRTQPRPTAWRPWTCTAYAGATA